jgi:hypothetical protein
MFSLSPKRQRLVLIFITAVVYIILARPVEKVTRFVVAGDKVYLTLGPAGFRMLDIAEEKVPAPPKIQSLGVEYVLKPVAKMIGSYNTLGYSYSLALRESQVLIADGSEGVVVLDITNPENPIKVGKTKVDGKAQDLALWKDNYAFVAVGRNGLRTVKINKNGQVSEVKDARIDERADVTRVYGDRLYVGGDEKITVFDLKESAKKPEPVGSYSVNGRIRDIQVVEQGGLSLAYIAADKQGVLSLDVTKPVSITEYLKFDTVGRAMGIYVHDGYALVAEGSKGLRLYDLTFKDDIRPMKPPFETWGTSTQVAVQDSLVYLADGASGLRVLEYLVQLQVKPDGGVPQAFTERSVLNAGSQPFVFLADGGRGLRVLRGNNLEEISYYDTPGYAGAAAIRWEEGRAVIADKDDLLVLDITDLKNPNLTSESVNLNLNAPQIRFLGAVGLTGESDILDVQLSSDGKLAYVANGAKGFWVVDISNPAQPKRIGEEALAGQAVDLRFARGHAYIAGNKGGLIIVNAMDSNSPTRVFPKDLSKPLLKDVMAVDLVDVTNQPLYVYTASQEGFCAIEVNDLDQPGVPKCLPVEGIAKDVMVDLNNNRAYLVTTRKADDQTETGLLYVFSIESRTNPQQVSATPIDRPLNRVMVNGDLVYLSMGAHGLRLVNVQNPAQTIATHNYPPLAQYFVSRDQFAYVTDGAGTTAGGSQGLSILDLSDKKKPRQVGLYRSTGQAYATILHPKEKLAYLADGSGGLHVVDIANPSRPLEVFRLPEAKPALHLAVMNNRLYLAAGDAGLWVFDITDPRRPKKLGELKAGVADGLPGAATWVGAYDDYVLVACKGSGLASVWVQDGSKPQLADINTVHKDVRRFFIRGNRLYAGAGVDGMVIYSLESPWRIEEIVAQPTSGMAEYVNPVGSYAFVAMGDQGIQIFMIENEVHPIPVGASLTPNPAVMLQAKGLDAEKSGIEPAGYSLYTAESSNGFRYYLVGKDLLLIQNSVYEPPGTAYFWEVFNFLVIRINTLINQTQEFLTVLKLGFLNFVIDWVQGKIDSLIRAIIRRLGTDPWPATGASPKAGWTLQRVLFFDWLVLGWFGLLFWAAFAAQFALPVQRYSERRQAVRRLWAFIRGRHGTMTRVYDGQIKRPADDAGWVGPGVALVDVVSAAVLEKRLHKRSNLGELKASLLGATDPPPDAPFGTRKVENGSLWNLWEPLRERINSRKAESAPKQWKKSTLTWELQKVFSEMRRRTAIPPERVEGRKLVFTETGGGRHGPGFDEVVAHGVDLRNQFRISGQEVLAHTRNGIELRSLIFCVFSVGRKPDTLLVTYKDGVRKAENIRVIYLEEKFFTAVSSTGLRRAVKRYRVKELSDELDPEDKREIDDYLRKSKDSLGEGKSLADLPTLKAENVSATGQPFVLSRERVFAAAASRAVDNSVDDQPAWHELPVRTAIEVYRNLLATQDYDNLYRPSDEREFPMRKFKSVVLRRVRNLGLINFQYIERIDNHPLKKNDLLDGPQDLMKSGKAGEYADLRRFPLQPLTYPKVLRARGIKVIAAGPTEMRPTNEDIRVRFMEVWRARWQRDAELRRAEYEIKAQRIRNQARVQSQRDMVGILTRIFASEELGHEAMALRVFQALERVAADPLTRQFLPVETIYMLNTLQNLLLPSGDPAGSSPQAGFGSEPPPSAPGLPRAPVPEGGKPVA